MEFKYLEVKIIYDNQEKHELQQKHKYSLKDLLGPR